MTGESGVAVQDVAYAGLDALLAALPLELCAYLHASPGIGPQLYLRAPDLSTMDATAAFDLFSALRDALEAGQPGARALTVAGFDAVAVLTAGATSQGLFVAGRASAPLEARERDVAERLAEAIGTACHALEGVARPHAERTPLRVAAEVGETGAHAEVVVPGPDGIRTGSADAATTTAAVAEATLAALGTGLKLGEVTDGEVAGEHVVIALVVDDAGASAVAAAKSGADHLAATAAAVLDAAARLSR